VAGVAAVATGSFFAVLPRVTPAIGEGSRGEFDRARSPLTAPRMAFDIPAKLKREVCLPRCSGDFSVGGVASLVDTRERRSRERLGIGERDALGLVSWWSGSSLLVLRESRREFGGECGDREPGRLVGEKDEGRGVSKEPKSARRTFRNTSRDCAGVCSMWDIDGVREVKGGAVASYGGVKGWSSRWAM
jgi:hypothetical protein